MRWMKPPLRTGRPATQRQCDHGCHPAKARLLGRRTDRWTQHRPYQSVLGGSLPQPRGSSLALRPPRSGESGRRRATGRPSDPQPLITNAQCRRCPLLTDFPARKSRMHGSRLRRSVRAVIYVSVPGQRRLARAEEVAGHWSARFSKYRLEHRGRNHRDRIYAVESSHAT
jgi:hypothetical protein